MIKIKVNNFDLESTLLSGQCFRVEKINDYFICILSDRVIKVKQDNSLLYIESSCYDNIEKVIYNYFDLDTDYEYINKIIDVDNIMHECINKCKGYKILKQDIFETCVSYIISQNNNVKRISNSINMISKDYGEKVIFEDKEYYLFPKYEVLKRLSKEEFRKYGVGFRDKYLVEFMKEYSSLNNLDELDTSSLLKRLMSIKGIGLKVASCIVLFSYSRFDCFPVDTWVKQFMSNNYNINGDIKKIESFCKDKFGKYSGLAIQYMFHSRRNK